MTAKKVKAAVKIAVVKPKRERAKRLEGRIDILLRDDLRRVGEDVSMVAHLHAMAVESHIMPEQMLRDLVSESPRFARRMAALWLDRAKGGE
jgi:hypothetical protein